MCVWRGREKARKGESALGNILGGVLGCAAVKLKEAREAGFN